MYNVYSSLNCSDHWLYAEFFLKLSLSYVQVSVDFERKLRLLTNAKKKKKKIRRRFREKMLKIIDCIQISYLFGII